VSEKSIILGRAGCGRTTLLLETFCNHVKAQRETPIDGYCHSDDVLFLLPTHSQVEHIKDVIIRKGFAPGFVEKGICTFSQLARETLGYHGLKGPISELEKGIILREVLGGLSPGYFEGRGEFKGLHLALLSFFKELKEDGQYPSQFRRAVDKFLEEKGTAFPDKYTALTEVYSSFQKALEEEGLLDDDDLLNQLLRSLEDDSNLLSQKKLLLVDGFHDFTPVEFRILNWLINRVPRVLVSLVLDKETTRLGRSPLFERSRDVYKGLKAFGLKPKLLQGFQRSTSPTLRQVESGVFNPSSKPIEADASLEVMEAADMRDEVEQIARRIYQMASRGEARYHDIVVIFREVAPYRATVEAVFQEYNIPVRIHALSPLIENPPVKCLLLLLQVFISSWRDEEVMHALKSPYLMLPHTEVDLLEFKASEYGRMDSREAWRGLAEKGPFPKIQEFIKDLTEMEKVLEGPHPSGFFKSCILRAIDRFLLFSETANPSSYWSASGGKEEAQGLRAFLELLDRQCQLITVPITLKAFFEELQWGLSYCLYTPKDKRHEVVNVIDTLEARQWEKPVVFVGGLLEKQFPRQGREDLFLKDRERRAFKKLTGINLQEVLSRIHEEERFLFYVALTRARHKLILSYPATDSQGRPALPSFYLEEVKRLFTPESYKRFFQKRTPGDFVPQPQEVLTQKDLRNFLFHHLTSPYTHQAQLARRVYNRELNRQTPWLEGLRVALARPEEGELGIGDLLKETMPSFSATQLSDYAQCPFLHFCRWILRLMPLPSRAEEGLSPTLQGQIVHETLKDYYGPKRAANPEDLFQETFSRKTRGIPLGFREEKLKKEMLHALKVFAEQDKEDLGKSPFKPKYLEVGFGREARGSVTTLHGDEAVSISLPPLILRDREGNKVRLTGRIDRIDVAEIDGESLGLVIDYKYSREAADGSKLKKDLQEGTDLQLPLYVMVARDLLGLRPAGAQFYSLKPPGRSGIIAVPLPNRGELIDQEEMEAHLESCKEHLFRQVAGILSGEKGTNPKDTRRCRDWCEYREVCRFESVRYKKHED
jgi:ATP-dependent helicase/nuclease subunit B